MTLNLDAIFRQTAARQPRHPAIQSPGPDDGWTYEELNDAITAAAELLGRAGIRPGHCVGLHCASGAQYVVLNYAVWRCGGCVVPIPVELTADEKTEVYRGIALDYVVSHNAGQSFLEPLARGVFTEVSANATVVPVHSYRQRPKEFSSINGAFIRFTSGTTGSSKGVVLSHETIFDRIHAANEVLHVGPHDRIVWMLSMSYHFAVSIVSYLSFGATIVLVPNQFARAVLEAISRHRATMMYASPMHYALMADFDGDASVASLRQAISTTASTDPQTLKKFYWRFGVPLTQALGIIEIGLPCINVDFAEDRSDGVGKVLPAYELQLTDVGLGPDLKEIAFRGKGLLDAYYDPWQPRSEIMADGWFHTGDVGQLDADGCLFLRGRTKDVINVMGMKFFPQEVESVLMSHPAVTGACVFSHRDQRLGEVPYARVVAGRGAASPLPGERELLEYCQGKVAAYKVPHKIEFVTRLPRTASGKVLHRYISSSADSESDTCEILSR
jgi:long-chain acyl-CoA synthetase